MKIMCVLAHPKEQSFNRVILAKVLETISPKGHEAYIWDLYGLKFDPVLTFSEIQRGFSLDPLVQKAYKQAQEADCFVFIHPIWWGNMPAILKGFIDRVFRSGVAYDFIKNDKGEIIKEVPFKGKKALVFLTSDSEEEITYSPEGIWKAGIANFCEMDFFIKPFWNLAFSTYEDRLSFLSNIPQAIEETFI